MTAVRRTLAAVAATALLAGCSTENSSGDRGDRASDHHVTTAVPAPGPVDIGFAQDMAVHHEQALRMAELAQTRATPAVVNLAGPMLITQARETGVLRGWLLLWDAPQLPSGDPMTWMDGAHHHDEGSPMPGMATTAQMQRLESLEGRAFDVLFLELMIRHHRGGLPMAEYAVAHAEVSAVADVAVQMIADQSMEISQMVALRNSMTD